MIGIVDLGVGFGYFLCNLIFFMKCMGFFSCGGIERFDEMKFIGMVLIVVLVEDFYFVKDVKNK